MNYANCMRLFHKYSLMHILIKHQLRAVHLTLSAGRNKREPRRPHSIGGEKITNSRQTRGEGRGHEVTSPPGSSQDALPHLQANSTVTSPHLKLSTPLPPPSALDFSPALITFRPHFLFILLFCLSPSSRGSAPEGGDFWLFCSLSSLNPKASAKHTVGFGKCSKRSLPL